MASASRQEVCDFSCCRYHCLKQNFRLGRREMERPQTWPHHAGHVGVAALSVIRMSSFNSLVHSLPQDNVLLCIRGVCLQMKEKSIVNLVNLKRQQQEDRVNGRLWCHLQLRPTRIAKNRSLFSSAPPKAPLVRRTKVGCPTLPSGSRAKDTFNEK